MNTNSSRLAQVALTTSGVVIATLAMVPTPAYAAGAEILIPKLEEFLPALIAFLVIWAIIAKVAGPTIMKVFDERQAKIEQDLQAAEDAKVEAEVNARAGREQVVAAQTEAANIISAAKREAEEERARIISEAQASSQALIAKARDAIDAERRKAMVELSGQVVDLSVEIASKIIGDALSHSEQQELAEKYLLEVGSLNDE